jgi:hypothetical protein
MIIFTSVTNPVYATFDNLAINCVVEAERDGSPCGIHNYTATFHDEEPHGAKLWSDLIAGVYGEIAPYVAPVSE